MCLFARFAGRFFGGGLCMMSVLFAARFGGLRVFLCVVGLAVGFGVIA